jgi:hypothetical protein
MKNMKLDLREETQTLVIEIDLKQVSGVTANGNFMVASTTSWEKLDEIQPGLSLNLALVQKKGTR